MDRRPILLASLLLIAGCSPEERADRQKQFSSSNEERSAWDMPTESYSGMVKGTEVIFEHLNYTRYRLTLEGEVTEGEMNTERGFEDDENATLYILNSDQPESEQAFFVRHSNGDVWMLDQDRKPMPKARFTKQ